MLLVLCLRELSWAAGLFNPIGPDLSLSLSSLCLKVVILKGTRKPKVLVINCTIMEIIGNIGEAEHLSALLYLYLRKLDFKIINILKFPVSSDGRMRDETISNLLNLFVELRND